MLVSTPGIAELLGGLLFTFSVIVTAVSRRGTTLKRKSKAALAAATADTRDRKLICLMNSSKCDPKVAENSAKNSVFRD